MKILSKYKDYYDYLSGIYGEDPKIVLDRRQFTKKEFSRPEKITLYICGWIYEGYFYKDKFYWGDNLKLLGKYYDKSNDKNYDFRFLRETKPFVEITNPDYRYGEVRVHVSKYKDNEFINLKENSPIIIQSLRNDYSKFPILKDLGISSVLPAQELYLMLTEWLSPKENTIDNRTNKEKILTNGFDLQTSFRNPIK